MGEDVKEASLVCRGTNASKQGEGQLQAKFGERLDGWVKASVAGWNNGGGGPGARATYTTGRVNTTEFKPSAIFVNPGYACTGERTSLVRLG